MLGFEPQSIQCSDYTDYTILAPECRTTCVVTVHLLVNIVTYC